MANEVGLYNPQPLIIYSDSTGATNLTKNPVQHQRTKHVDIKYHFIRQKVSSGEVIMLYLRTDQQPADSLTKALDHQKFEQCREAMGLQSASW